MAKQRYDLSQCEWRLKGTAPYVPLRGKSMETGGKLEGITEWIPADVPGGVALALYRAGYIEHPYYGMNSLKCEWIENKWWIYETSFSAPKLAGTKVRLDFLGVDYECMAYWNKRFLGTHEGMFDPFSWDLTDFYREGEPVTLRVLLKHAPDEMGQIGRTSETFTQKSRFNYKWDFGTRLVNLGIWKNVYLTGVDRTEMEDVFIRGETDENGIAHFRISAKVTGHGYYLARASFWLENGEKASVEQEIRDGRIELSLPVENPVLWYPNGLGEPRLYDVAVSLYQEGELLDRVHKKCGIRKIVCLQNENAPLDARPYLLSVNGIRMYVKGVNLTPLDHIYGDIPKEQTEDVLRRAVDMNCNLVRVWGGGIIETEYFYECCDRLGLLVWQEFIQSSSGIDNIPSKNPEFLKLLKRSAYAAVMEKRNHTCLAIWSGGNELMDENRIPVTETDPNIAMLHEIVAKEDPERIFLPTSASGPGEFISLKPNRSHDVHGWWQYQGNPQHYEFYSESDSLFHSEFGCDGMSSLACLQRFLPESDRLRPVAMHENDGWRFHGEWWCTWSREKEMFGSCADLSRYIAASQWMQAEGLRYILEANQRRKFRNSGSIIWQLNEPWPNVSATSLLEYYGRPKMAYYWAKNAFGHFCPTFDYRKLHFAPEETFRGKLWLFTDSMVTEGKADITAQILDLNGKIMAEWKNGGTIGSNRSNPMGELEWKVPKNFNSIFILRLAAWAAGFTGQNMYYFSTQKETPYRNALESTGAKVDLQVLCTQKIEERYGEVTAKIENIGNKAALHVNLIDRSDRYLLYPEDNYVTLFPNEVRNISIKYRLKYRFGFDENMSAQEGKFHLPDLDVEWVGKV